MRERCAEIGAIYIGEFLFRSVDVLASWAINLYSSDLGVLADADRDCVLFFAEHSRASSKLS